MKLSIPDADTLWDTLSPTRRHELTLMVEPQHLDEMNHVNNTVYLVWARADRPDRSRGAAQCPRLHHRLPEDTDPQVGGVRLVTGRPRRAPAGVISRFGFGPARHGDS